MRARAPARPDACSGAHMRCTHHARRQYVEELDDDSSQAHDPAQSHKPIGKFAGNLSGEVGKREKKCTLTSKEILTYPNFSGSGAREAAVRLVTTSYEKAAERGMSEH